jgi:hypothetical protein
VIFKTVICGREVPVCADSSRKAITAEKNGRLFDYEEACNGSSTSARLFPGEFTSVSSKHMLYISCSSNTRELPPYLIQDSFPRVIFARAD